MIRIAFILILGLFASCHTPKTVVEEPAIEPGKETPTPPENAQQTYYLGEVQLLDCGPVIHVSTGGKRPIFAPVNLDPKLHVDKLRLKLTFKILPEQGVACKEFSAIEITEAFAVR